MRNEALARLSGIAGKMEGGKIGCGIADFRHATSPSSPQSTQSRILVCIRFYFLPLTPPPLFFWCHAIDFHLWHRIFARSKNNKRTGCDSWQPTAPGTFGVNTSFGFQWLNWLLRGHKLASTWPLTSAPFDSLK